MNVERFVLMLQEYCICEVVNHFYSINEFNEDEHVFLLESGEEVKVTMPNKE